MRRSLLAVSALLVVSGFAAGGLYSPDDPCPFIVKPDGTADPLPFSRFAALYLDRGVGLFPPDPAKPGTLDWVTDGGTARSTYGGVLQQQYAARQPVEDKLTGPDLAAHTAVLIRLGGTGQAIRLLNPELRARNPNYQLVANLVQAHADRNEWDVAQNRFSLALDCDPPAPFGPAPERLTWQMAVDRKYYRQWLKVRKADAAKRPDPATAEPDAIFLDADGKPVRFWENDAERAKLPPDVIAVAQQLALWAPSDSKLLWLLAELYRANGRVREADALYEMCVARQLTGFKLLMTHRAEVKDLVAKLPTAVPDAPLAVEGDGQPDGPKGLFALVDPVTFYVVGGLFVLATTGLLVLQVWSLSQRRRR